MREVLTVSFGQAGVQLDDVIWKHYCADDGSFRRFFEETNGGLFVPRNLSLIDDIRKGDLSNLFHPEFLLNSKQDAANKFAREHYTVRKEIIDKVNDRRRKLVNNCDNVQGFVVNHSVGGIMIIKNQNWDLKFIQVHNFKWCS